MVRAASLAALLLAVSATASASAEPITELIALEIIPFDDEPVAEKVLLEDEPATEEVLLEDEVPAVDELRLDLIVNPFDPYSGYQFPVVNEIIDPFRESAGPSRIRPESYAELCRRYCRNPPSFSSVEPAPRSAPLRTSSFERERLFEQRQSNADLRLMGGLVLGGTVLGALALIAGDPSFENDLGFMGSGLLIGSGLVVGLALVTTGDHVELRFARNTVARTR
jgi:hypothetical protein